MGPGWPAYRGLGIPGIFVLAGAPVTSGAWVYRWISGNAGWLVRNLCGRGMGTNKVSRAGHASPDGVDERGGAGARSGEADAAVLPGRNGWTLTGE